jgi:hypothetical protein
MISGVTITPTSRRRIDGAFSIGDELQAKCITSPMPGIPRSMTLTQAFTHQQHSTEIGLPSWGGAMEYELSDPAGVISMPYHWTVGRVATARYRGQPGECAGVGYGRLICLNKYTYPLA